MPSGAAPAGSCFDRSMPSGLASAALAPLAERVLGAWDSFLELAGRVDPQRPSRLPGWRGQEVLAHLGSWPDRAGLADLLHSAGQQRPHPVDVDAENARVTRAHAGATHAELLAALGRGRQASAELLGSEQARTFALAPVPSALGPLPLLTVVHATCYELAVHALDLAPCGAGAPPAELLDAGLAALVDVTGALAARAGLTIEVAAQTPTGGWRLCAQAGAGWSTEAIGPDRVPGPAVAGSAADLLDVSAGRSPAAALLVTRRLRVQDLGAFLRLAGILEQVPGLPGGAALRAAARGLSGAGSLLARLPRRG